MFDHTNNVSKISYKICWEDYPTDRSETPATVRIDLNIHLSKVAMKHWEVAWPLVKK